MILKLFNKSKIQKLMCEVCASYSPDTPFSSLYSCSLRVFILLQQHLFNYEQNSKCNITSGIPFVVMPEIPLTLKKLILDPKNS